MGKKAYKPFPAPKTPLAEATVIISPAVQSEPHHLPEPQEPSTLDRPQVLSAWRTEEASRLELNGMGKAKEPAPPRPDDLIPLADAARQLRICPNHLKRWILDGEIPAWRAGKSLYISQADIDEKWQRAEVKRTRTK